MKPTTIPTAHCDELPQALRALRNGRWCVQTTAPVHSTETSWHQRRHTSGCAGADASKPETCRGDGRSSRRTHSLNSGGNHSKMIEYFERRCFYLGLSRECLSGHGTAPQSIRKSTRNRDGSSHVCVCVCVSRGGGAAWPETCPYHHGTLQGSGGRRILLVTLRVTRAACRPKEARKGSLAGIPHSAQTD